MPRRIVKFFAPREPWLAEFFSSVTCIGWAVLTGISPEEMGDWPSMAYLVAMAGASFWVKATAAMGLVQLCALLADQRRVRWVAAVLMTWFWSVITLGVWHAVPWAPGVAVYAGWVGVNLFSILRLLRP